ncbi:MAG: Ig-like domain-containing protein, partial [Polyangiales bacterium]
MVGSRVVQMRGFSIAMAVTLASAAAMVPTGVRACSCTVEPIYHSQPAKGARNVPVDVAPVIEGPFDAATVTLEDEHGVKPSFTLSLGPRVGCIGGWAELVPWQPLAANTRYTIRVEALYKAS